jgi:hypothetical protein
MSRSGQGTYQTALLEGVKACPRAQAGHRQRVVYLSLHPEPLGQRRRPWQPGPGDRPLVVEGDIDLVQHHVRGWHRKGVLRFGDHDRLATVMLPGQEAVLVVTPRPRRT